MIIWGGDAPDNQERAGASYDPALDAWRPVTTVGSPENRTYHTALWTGTEMIIWGGRIWGVWQTDGARYNPASDTWIAMSDTEPPIGPLGYSAVWTGERMILWGGYDLDLAQYFNTGAIYDPATDSWTSTSLTNAPTPRGLHSAVWTGQEMIIWGTQDPEPGGRYDPVTGSWTPVSVSGAPSDRTGHSAAWTGEEMIVWGGNVDGVLVNTGGRYEPVADAWSPMSTVDAPTPRYQHTTVWADGLFVVWGGYNDDYLQSGSRYDSVTDAWAATSMDHVPSPRGRHTAVWTGSDMLIWGGHYSTATGGRYALGHGVDGDQDSFTECEGDCNDDNADVHPGATEVCNGFDDDCDLSLPPDEVDDDDDGFAECLGWPRGGDCNDFDPSVYPGAAEANDGQDNQCPGDLGYGLIDEVEGGIFDDPLDKTSFSWVAQPGATQYEVAESNASGFPAVECATWFESVAETTLVDEPTSGEVLFYLIRSTLPNSGSWGAQSDQAQRTVACSSN
jgi:N-acetylneuraminic acid mutarotase